MRISDWSSDVCSSDLCYRGLGLSPADLDRHIAWDIGAAALTRRLAEMLDAPAFLGAYSRLLIDLNRPLDIPGSIPVRSEATIVPGNDALSREERESRRDRIFAPFQQALAAAAERRIDEIARATCRERGCQYRKK